MNALACCRRSTLAMVLFGAPFTLAGAFAAAMTHADYSAHKSQIEADYKTDKVACDRLGGNDKDVCVEKAKGKQSVAMAELEYNDSGKQSDADKLAVVKADADYSVAKERCDDKKGNHKDLCVKDAKAAHAKALSDARMSKKVSG